MEGLVVNNPHKLFVGDNFLCNIHCYINAGGTVTIGNNVLLGPFVKIWSVNHRFDDLETPVWQQGWDMEPVVIEDNVWVGAGVFVAPGVTVGERSIVAAGTVLTKPVSSFSLVGGNPGRIIKNLK